MVCDVLGAKRALHLGGLGGAEGFHDKADPGFVGAGVLGLNIRGVEHNVLLAGGRGGDLVEADVEQPAATFRVVGGCFEGESVIGDALDGDCAGACPHAGEGAHRAGGELFGATGQGEVGVHVLDKFAVCSGCVPACLVFLCKQGVDLPVAGVLLVVVLGQGHTGGFEGLDGPSDKVLFRSPGCGVGIGGRETEAAFLPAGVGPVVKDSSGDGVGSASGGGVDGSALEVVVLSFAVRGCALVGYGVSQGAGLPSLGSPLVADASPYLVGIGVG